MLPSFRALSAAGCVFALGFLASCGQQERTAVDSIWTARYVVTMDSAHRVIQNGAVAITGDHIIAAGPRDVIDRNYAASNRLDLFKRYFASDEGFYKLWEEREIACDCVYQLLLGTFFLPRFMCSAECHPQLIGHDQKVRQLVPFGVVSPKASSPATVDN